MNRNLQIVMMWKKIDIKCAEEGFYLADKRKCCTGRIPILGLHLPFALFSNVPFNSPGNDSNIEQI